MKPSTARLLDALRQGPQTTHSLMQADVGGLRFGARLLELRQAGYEVTEERLPLPTRGSLYTLVSEPSGSSTSGAPRDPSAPGPATVSGTPRTTVPGVGQAPSEAKGPLKREQAAPGPVASTEAARAAAPAEPSGLFDAAVYEPERHSYKDAAA